MGAGFLGREVEMAEILAYLKSVGFDHKNDKEYNLLMGCVWRDFGSCATLYGRAFMVVDLEPSWNSYYSPHVIERKAPSAIIKKKVWRKLAKQCKWYGKCKFEPEGRCLWTHFEKRKQSPPVSAFAATTSFPPTSEAKG